MNDHPAQQIFEQLACCRSHHAALVYAVLVAMGGKAESLSQLAIKAGYSDTTIRSAVNSLHYHKLITVEDHGGSKGGRYGGRRVKIIQFCDILTG